MTIPRLHMIQPDNHLFPELPDSARVWVHVLGTPLSEVHLAEFDQRLSDLIQSWTSHQRPVKGDYVIADKQIIVVGAFVAEGDISGCGIDKHVRLIDELVTRLDYSRPGPLDVIYRDDDGALRICPRFRFQTEIENRSLVDTTRVVDTTVTDLETARKAGIEREAAATWFADAFQFVRHESAAASSGT